MTTRKIRTAHWDETKQDWIHPDEQDPYAPPQGRRDLAQAAGNQSVAGARPDAGEMGVSGPSSLAGRRRTARWSEEHGDYIHESDTIPTETLTQPRVKPTQASGPADPYAPFAHIMRQKSGLRGQPLLDDMKHTLAKLVALRETIHEQDKHLLRQAIETHDFHHDRANGLRDDLADKSPGDEPLLEDAYGHHLHARSQADDVMSKLAHRHKIYRPMVGEGSDRPISKYHPWAMPMAQAVPDDNTPRNTPMGNDPQLPQPETVNPVAHESAHDDLDLQSAPQVHP